LESNNDLFSYTYPLPRPQGAGGGSANLSARGGRPFPCPKKKKAHGSTRKKMPPAGYSCGRRRPPNLIDPSSAYITTGPSRRRRSGTGRFSFPNRPGATKAPLGSTRKNGPRGLPAGVVRATQRCGAVCFGPPKKREALWVCARVGGGRGMTLFCLAARTGLACSCTLYLGG
jgi:hypothetical protein